MRLAPGDGRRPAQAALLALALAGAGCGGDRSAVPADPGGHPWFEEVARGVGLDFVHVRGRVIRHWFPEIMSGGAGWIDYDGDGDLDVYFVQGGELDGDAPPGPPNRLFRNDGDRFVDVTAAAGVGHRGYGMGCAVGDYDGDGDIDLYVTNVGPNVLFENGGDGTFRDVTAEAGVGHPGWGASAGFVDHDADGDLDLFVANYVNWSPGIEVECYSGDRQRDYCGPTRYKAPAADALFRNLGNGRFEDASVEAGLLAAFGTALGVGFGDFDGDGLVDLYVANDGMLNQLWVNRGAGTFADEGLLSGAALNGRGEPEAGMGVAVADLESDGDPDLFVTHLGGETNTFYRNRGAGLFEDASAALGLGAPSFRYTGFGTALADFDHDGRLDVYVANGRVSRDKEPHREDDPFAEPNQLYRGLDAGTFEVVSPHERGGDGVDNSRAAAFGDYDGDGDLDVALNTNDGPARLLRNVAGGRGAWLVVEARTAAGGPALGAAVAVSAAGRRQLREMRSAYSYCAANAPAAHFGLGEVEGTSLRVEVSWPGGRRRTFTELSARRRYLIPFPASGRGARDP